jgi:hypothetical protein
MAREKGTDEKIEAMNIEQPTSPTIIQQMVNKEDAIIRQIMEEQKVQEFPSIDALALQMWEDHKGMFELPDACKKKLGDFAFVWVETDERMLRLYKKDFWKIVNRINSPWMPDSEFHVSGAIERHGYARHVLMYMPRPLHNAIEQRASRLSRGRIKDLDKSGDDRFYMQEMGTTQETTPRGHYQVGAEISPDGKAVGDANFDFKGE